MWERRFRALGEDLAVCADDDLAAAVEPLVGTFLAARGEPRHRFVVGGPGAGTVMLDGNVVWVAVQRRDAADQLERELYRLVCRSRDGWLLHAAAVELAGRAWVLAGPSGAGKSTLALGLVARGAHYLSDEIVLVQGDLAVRGLARPLSFDAERAPRIPTPAWRKYHTESRASGGGSVRAARLVPPAGAIAHEALPLGGLVRIAHAPADSYLAARLGPGEAVASFWECGFAPTATALEVATRAVAGVSCFTLATRSVEEACEQVERLAATESPAACGRLGAGQHDVYNGRY